MRNHIILLLSISILLYSCASEPSTETEETVLEPQDEFQTADAGSDADETGTAEIKPETGEEIIPDILREIKRLTEAYPVDDPEMTEILTASIELAEENSLLSGFPDSLPPYPNNPFKDSYGEHIFSEALLNMYDYAPDYVLSQVLISILAQYRMYALENEIPMPDEYDAYAFTSVIDSLFSIREYEYQYKFVKTCLEPEYDDLCAYNNLLLESFGNSDYPAFINEMHHLDFDYYIQLYVKIRDSFNENRKTLAGIMPVLKTEMKAFDEKMMALNEQILDPEGMKEADRLLASWIHLSSNILLTYMSENSLEPDELINEINSFDPDFFILYNDISCFFHSRQPWNLYFYYKNQIKYTPSYGPEYTGNPDDLPVLLEEYTGWVYSKLKNHSIADPYVQEAVSKIMTAWDSGNLEFQIREDYDSILYPTDEVDINYINKDSIEIKVHPYLLQLYKERPEICFIYLVEEIIGWKLYRDAMNEYDIDYVPFDDPGFTGNIEAWIADLISMFLKEYRDPDTEPWSPFETFYLDDNHILDHGITFQSMDISLAYFFIEIMWNSDDYDFSDSEDISRFFSYLENALKERNKLSFPFPVYMAEDRFDYPVIKTAVQTVRSIAGYILSFSDNQDITAIEFLRNTGPDMFGYFSFMCLYSNVCHNRYVSSQANRIGRLYWLPLDLIDNARD